MKINHLNSNDEFISLYKETKNVLKENGILLNKKLGQHYLIDDFKRKKILEYGNLNKKDTILEIGPGIGTLSLHMSEKVKKIIAIEKDLKIYKILQKRIENNNIDNIELINQDTLKIDFPKFNKVISNLPYQISSPVTFKLLDYDFDFAILMYQKEFANRMVAKVNEKNYSRLSAMLYFKCEILHLNDLSPENFYPKPKIKSSVIKMSPKKIDNKKKDILDNQYTMVSKALFQHKKKTVKNALVDSRHELNHSDKKELNQILTKLSKNNKALDNYFKKKVIKMSPEEILDLSIHLKDIIKKNKKKVK
ncbi:16S rRNA (adenine(1518)-N(6)/adenine(1519)-N(6))-dimethyltransferase RsmA [Methanobrevibacter curvatus]|uniref:Probable ribosomal RNA small subunit methyltransferase A n=1 Tax=Methanobrevibacter curvatus TaxID=49547 RepID=A0A166DV67_9EURY|nr:16S rRNA (adenine(1518)-N(6)/adenine(1519)-N(6))-dimethyltransferase RsmA [Methanobrevibacter curvatus]KZX15986.1 ribosomal RNA small subunit methyltransferase A [Methanobrevibacter curvatus]